MLRLRKIQVEINGIDFSPCFRTVRWLDRCLSANAREEEQSIFPIVQGGLDEDLRKRCAQLLTERKVNGFAIGGLRSVFFIIDLGTG